MLAEKIIQGDRFALSRAITLCESSLYSDKITASTLLEKILPYSGKSIRVGVSGVPGAGKSTFIEALGIYLLSLKMKVAVLAVDPSSSRTRGSIMGDKTRMPKLSNHPAAYIRPSSTGKTLGGIAAATHEAMLLCEAAGFDIILIETTGVGQSEILVKDMTDHFLLLLLTGAGDDIQLLKKGIMEVTDTVVINKAEGENLIAAEKLKKELFLWNHELPVHLSSSINNTGIKEVWDSIIKSIETKKVTSSFLLKRKDQNIKWMHQAALSFLENIFYQTPGIKDKITELEQQVSDSELPATSAALKLLEIFTKK